MSVPHPFYPLDSNLVGYVAMDWDVSEIFSVFGVGIMVVLLATRMVSQKLSPNLHGRDQAFAVWFMISGTIHLIIEGYFSYNHRRMPQMNDYLGQGWKEYAKSDSRYMTADPTVLVVESIAAWILGPMCILTAWMIFIDSPWRYPIQALVSGGQLYGVFLYYTTNMLDYHYKAITYSRPEALYYWGYFVGLNFFWFVIPTLCIYSSTKHTGRAFLKLKELQAAEVKG